jgi:hypothetical protein
LISDSGSEFVNRKMAVLKKEKDFEHIFVEPGNHRRLSRVDRFHKTLRDRFRYLKKERGNTIWYDKLDDILANYNSTPHRSLKHPEKSDMRISPNRADDPENKKEIQKEDLDRAVTTMSYIRENVPLKPGDSVRVVRNKKTFEKKGNANWSKTVYIIDEKKGPNLFSVVGRDEIYKTYELQKVRSVAPAANLYESKQKSRELREEVKVEKKRRKIDKKLKEAGIEKSAELRAGSIRGRAPSSRLKNSLVIDD